MVCAVAAGRSLASHSQAGDPTRGCRKQVKGKVVPLLEDSFRQCGMAGEHAPFCIWFMVLPVT